MCIGTVHGMRAKNWRGWELVWVPWLPPLHLAGVKMGGELGTRALIEKLNRSLNRNPGSGGRGLELSHCLDKEVCSLPLN